MITPSSLALTLLPDGRVLLELLAGWYKVLAIEEARVDDESVAAVVERWAADLPTEPQPRAAARGDRGREYGRGFAGHLSDRSREGLERSRWPRLLAVLTGTTEPAEVAKTANDLAVDLRILLRRSRERALARDARGAYRAVLQQYVKELSSYRSVQDQGVYRLLEPTIGVILRDEQYLLLAADPHLRDLYLQVRTEMSALYQWCMDLDRGGIERAR
ncbi:hypothetical protein [Pseudactinotalea sp.]|uniref:hypothetical protein n=1 Tax=Pseudactinotalea sp. TaxID=1926260 RepID=UPI003B3B79BD